MAKVKGALHSDSVGGKFAGQMIFRRGKKNITVTSFYKPGSFKKFIPSEFQLAQREKYGKAVEAWRALSPSEKDIFNGLAKISDKNISGWNLFFKQFEITSPYFALDFLGVQGDYFYSLVYDKPLYNAPREIGIWFKATTVPVDYMTLFSYGTGDAGKPICFLCLRSDGRVYTETGSGSNYIFSLTPMNDGQAHFVSLTYDNYYLRLYVDNVLQGEVYDEWLETQDSEVRIGDMVWATGYPFSGQIKQTFIFNRVLTDVERAIIYNNGNGLVGSIDIPPFSSGLVAGWNFNEGSGETLSDFSGNNNTGYIINPHWVEWTY